DSLRANGRTRIGLARRRASGLGRRHPVLELRDLRDEARVHLDSRERRVGPRLDDLGSRGTRDACRQAEYVGIVLLAAVTGRGDVRTERGADTSKLVRGNRRARGAAADEHTGVGKTAKYRLTDDPRVVRIVHRVGGKATEVQDDVSLRFERRDEGRLHRETRVVAADGDAHGMGKTPWPFSHREGWPPRSADLRPRAPAMRYYSRERWANRGTTLGGCELP